MSARQFFSTRVRGGVPVHHQPWVIRPVGNPPYYPVIRCGGTKRGTVPYGHRKSRRINAVTCRKCLLLYAFDCGLSKPWWSGRAEMETT